MTYAEPERLISNGPPVAMAGALLASAPVSSSFIYTDLQPRSGLHPLM
jgi:hypothetical protein